MRIRPRSLIQHAALVIGGLAAGLCLLEIGVRLFAEPDSFYNEMRSPPPIASDPVLGWRRPPGVSFTLIRDGRSREIRTNSEGFRDLERQRDKPAGTTRIAIVGDSFVEAVEVAFEATFPRLLERRLNGAGRAPRVEVLNFGMRGYGTAQEYLLLQDRALAYRPDVVVLVFFVGNDIYDNGLLYSMRYRPRPGPFFRLDTATGRLVRVDPPAEEVVSAVLGHGLVERTLARIPRFLWGHLQLYGMVVSRLQQWPGVGGAVRAAGLGAPVSPHDGDIFSATENAELAEAWRVTEALLSAMSELVRVNTGTLLVVGVPHPVQFPAYLRLYHERVDRRLAVEEPDRPSRMLGEVLGRYRIPYLDLLPLFRAHLTGPTRPDLYLLSDGHFTESAHALVAEALLCELARLRLAGRLLDLPGPAYSCPP
jgi:lysophospholipase L1-like esterase